MAELQKMCRLLDVRFFQGCKYNLRVHAIYFKPGDKYVNVACRIKNCPFRLNHKYEVGENGKIVNIRFYQTGSGCHSI